MTNTRRSVLYGLSFLVIVVLVGAGVHLHRLRQEAVAEVPPPEAVPWAVHVATVTRGPVERGFPVLAEISARRETTISGQVTGTILEMGPREGVAVKAGDLLARIDTRELVEQRDALAAQLKGARADARRARKDLARDEKLLESRTISQAAVDTARAASIAADEKVRSLERQIRALEVRIGYGMVTAPADGVVAARLAEPGDVCRPDHPLYRLTMSGAARIRVRLPQTVLEQVHPGTTLVLRHGDKTLRIPLNRIHPALDTHALGAAEADLTERPFGLPSGSRLAARVVLQQRDHTLRISRRALLHGQRPGTGTVLKVLGSDGEDHLAAVPVTVALEGRDAVAVAGALEAGDRVVVAHESTLMRLKDGDPVRVFAGPAP